MRSFDYEHLVGFEETNLVGNVYYVNHLRWQGRCREMFLRQHCPEIVARLGHELVLATVRCSCEYLAELAAFDQVTLRMTLAEMVQNRITMRFDYSRRNGSGEQPVARGEQQIACMQRTSSGVEPVAIPEGLRRALEAYRR